MRPVLPHVVMALVTVATLAMPQAALAQAAPTPAATITEVSGPVTWHAQGETAFKDAKVGALLFTGAVLRTGVRGNARLKWRNGGEFHLLPLSELMVPEDEGVLVNTGKVWAQFREKLLGPFYFKSPSATAVVRGTILSVGLNPDESTTVEVLEGRVEVTSAKGGPSRMLEPGQSLIITPFGAMGPIQPVDPSLRLFERGFPPQGPGSREPGMRPERGPDGAPDRGPERGPNRPPQGTVDWLRSNRASVRLEPMRQEERGRRELRLQAMPGQGERQPPMFDRRGPRGQGMPPRPGDPTGRQPMTDPNRAFPAGRTGMPGGFQLPPGCDPAPMMTPPPPGTPPDCPPPPPPSGAQMR